MCCYCLERLSCCTSAQYSLDTIVSLSVKLAINAHAMRRGQMDLFSLICRPSQIIYLSLGCYRISKGAFLFISFLAGHMFPPQGSDCPPTLTLIGKLSFLLMSSLKSLHTCTTPVGRSFFMSCLILSQLQVTFSGEACGSGSSCLL